MHSPIRSLSALLAAVLVVSMLALAGCDSDMAVKVNGETITNAQVDAELDAIKEQYPQMFEGVDGDAREEDFRQRILDNLITNVLIRQAADDEGISISESDVDDEIDELKQGFTDDDAFEQSLASVGMTLDDLREQIEDQLLTEAIVDFVSEDVEVSDADVAAYYEENMEQFQEPAAVRAAHILFDAADKETGEEVLADIEAGDDFAALAKQYSTDEASAENGGDLGWPTTAYVSEFQAALDELEIGDVSPLVESPYGWHIITVLDERDETQRSLEDVTDEITLILRQQNQAEAFQQYVEGLKEEAEMEYPE